MFINNIIGSVIMGKKLSGPQEAPRESGMKWSSPSMPSQYHFWILTFVTDLCVEKLLSASYLLLFLDFLMNLPDQQ